MHNYKKRTGQPLDLRFWLFFKPSRLLGSQIRFRLTVFTYLFLDG